MSTAIATPRPRRNWAADPDAAWNDPVTHPSGEPARQLMRHGEWLVPESERPLIAPAPAGYELKLELKRVEEEARQLAYVIQRSIRFWSSSSEAA